MANACCAEGSNRIIIWCAGAANVGQMTNPIAVELSGDGEYVFERYVLIKG
jgi:uncharacterized metal-binding protein